MRLFSISYRFPVPCHGRGRGFEPRRPRHKSKRFMADDSPRKAEAEFYMGAIGTQPPKSRVRLILLLTQIWNHPSDNLTLRGSLERSPIMELHELRASPSAKAPS